jgi:hypothetical protein
LVLWVFLSKKLAAEASGALTSVTGGRLGKAPYFASTVLGGLEEVSEAEFGVTP